MKYICCYDDFFINTHIHKYLYVHINVEVFVKNNNKLYLSKPFKSVEVTEQKTIK